MASTLNFDITKLAARLNALEQSQINFASNRALKRIGYRISKEALPVDMDRYFRTPVPFTTRSVNYSVTGQTLRFSMNRDESKGNAPAKYLFPVTAAGSRSVGSPAEVYPTRFANWLWDKGYINKSQFPVPYTYNTEDIKLNKYNNVSAAVYQRTQVALARSSKQIGVTSKKLTKSGLSTMGAFAIKEQTGKISPGIYRRKTKDLKMLFSLVPALPKTSAVFPYQDLVFGYTERFFASELRKSIQDSIRY